MSLVRWKSVELTGWGRVRRARSLAARAERTSDLAASPEIVRPEGRSGSSRSSSLFGIFRFLQIVTVEAGGDSPTDMVVGDGPLRTAIAMWLLTFFVIIYVTP